MYSTMWLFVQLKMRVLSLHELSVLYTLNCGYHQKNPYSVHLHQRTDLQWPSGPTHLPLICVKRKRRRY